MTPTGSETSTRPLILRLDVTGAPMGWIPWQSAVVLESRAMIAWHAGDHFFTFRGGYNRVSGARSATTAL